MAEFDISKYAIPITPGSGVRSFADMDPELRASLKLFSSEQQRLLTEYAPNPSFRATEQIYRDNVRELERLQASRWQYTAEFARQLAENDEVLTTDIEGTLRKKKAKREDPGAIEEKGCY